MCVRAIVTRIPYCGAINQVARDDIIEALHEAFWSVILSLVPVIVGAFFLWLFDDSKDALSRGFIDTLSNGELYFLSTALMAPLLYLTIRQYPYSSIDSPDSMQAFPNRQKLLITAIIVIIICTLMFSALQVSVIIKEKYNITDSIFFI